MAEASQEDQILFYRLDRKIVNLPSMTDAFNESGKLAERDRKAATSNRTKLFRETL